MFEKHEKEQPIVFYSAVLSVCKRKACLWIPL